MILKFFLVFVAVLFSASNASAEQACTQMWCVEGFELSLNGENWPAGKYTFEVEAEGKKTVCHSTLPFNDCESQTMCDGDNVSIGESGCALPPKSHSFHAIVMNEVPNHFKLNIKHENGKSFNYEAGVEKKCSFPNGEKCDPHPCCSAKAKADVLWK